MTKYRFVALILSVILVVSCLSGCSRIERFIDNMLENTHNPLQDEEETLTQDEPEETQPSEEVQVQTGFVSCEFLYVYANPGEDQIKVGYLSYGDQVTVYETVTVAGVLWGRTESGWISLENISQSLEPLPTQPPVEVPESRMGITSGDYVNVRSGPGTQYEVWDNLRINTRLEILEVRDGWCKTSLGWIYQDYVYIDGTYGPDPSIMGSIKGMDVNIRSGPGTNYEIVGSTNTGDRYEFFYQTTVAGRKWGCTSVGWICMEFVKLDGTPATGQPGPTVPK